MDTRQHMFGDDIFSSQCDNQIRSELNFEVNVYYLYYFH